LASAFQLIEMGDIVRIITSLLAFGLLAAPALAETKTFNDVSVVDVACSKKVAADADSHTRDCALKCKESGFAIVTADNQVLKLDADGNAKVLKQLNASFAGKRQRRCAGRYAEGHFHKAAVALGYLSYKVVLDGEEVAVVN
jgi:hypothetical protein